MELFPDITDPVHPAAPYIGGKRKLSRMICRAIDRIPHHTYAEAFMGMGGVFLRRTRVPPAEFINDWSEDVATFYRFLQRHYVAFLDMLRYQVATRSGFERLLKVDPATQTDLERAARFLYLQRLAYGGKVTQRSFGVDPRGASGFDITRLVPLLEAIHERLARVTIERLHWSDFLARYDTPATLFYLDPPYFGCEDDYGKELFDRSQFDLMATMLKMREGRFLLSLNDHPEVRRIFADFALVEVNLTYSISGTATDARELVISNVEQARLGQLLESGKGR
ncbi:MAG: DNA adenine methylase [Alphaproteobacteria bacterium]|nr:DNA adenine methylase [Alphaproteobacteria bacterium]